MLYKPREFRGSIAHLQAVGEYYQVQRELMFCCWLGAGASRECNNLRDGQFAPVDIF